MTRWLSCLMSTIAALVACLSVAVLFIMAVAGAKETAIASFFTFLIAVFGCGAVAAAIAVYEAWATREAYEALEERAQAWEAVADKLASSLRVMCAHDVSIPSTAEALREYDALKGGK